MQFATLQAWLHWQETLHPVTIDLGLDRFREALARVGFVPPTCPIITIAGTKGKGSCATLLDHVYRAQSYRTGLFTSPHLVHYNERIRIDGVQVTDAALCAVFARIEAVRGELSLTYFEFNALAAFLLFADAALDVWIIEVGLGGRLDAANALDADVAIVTAIGLDHTEWLGPDVESIGREKAGIARAHRPLVFGADDMPQSIAATAATLPAPLYRAGQQFGVIEQGATWSWWWRDATGETTVSDLPPPGIGGSVQRLNASTALAAIHLLQARLPMGTEAMRRGLRHATLAGRFQRQVDQHGIEWVLDVAHNAMSAAVLADHLRALPPRHTLAVLGLMADKDLDGMIAALGEQIDAYIAVALPGTRPLPVAQLTERLVGLGQRVLGAAADVPAACAQARGYALKQPAARVVVLGSFLSVGPALGYLGLVD